MTIARPSIRKVVRVPLARRVERIALSREVEELLFAHAELLTEARVDGAGYAGCTMITVDLAAVAERVRFTDRAAFERELLALVEGSVRVRLRAARFACAEASRRVPERSLDTFAIETRMRLEDSKLLIDVDVSAGFARGEREVAK